ncbi:mitochondrial carrier [Polychaeton citri CBS 116435]|uniref:Mitochondrial thiamine pyrophosphate carrier 1 n=1 Tax=Polychaeton citri CBS 116435 TaxID=1314669 RepID=A0A9P4Q6K5_9PEZI|nr:mitochondrial carrier [Polychaeton citri CBS 116435]
MDGEPHGETRAEREARVRALWEKLDTKKKGTLDLPALKNGLNKLDHPLKDADTLIHEVLDTADINHDGKISYDEFCKFVAHTEDELWKLFNNIDRDHSGELDKEELSSAFEAAGVKVQRDRLDRFFGYIDKDHNGTISFAEWRDFLLFIPPSALGMKAVLSYYQNAVRVSSEGDVHLSDQALNSFGTTNSSSSFSSFLARFFFGAILQLVKPLSPRLETPWEQQRIEGRDYIGDFQDGGEIQQDLAVAAYTPSTGVMYAAGGEGEELIQNEDPHIPIKPARRKPIPSQSKPSSVDGSQVEEEEEEGEEKVGLTLTDLIPNPGYFVAGGVSGITSRTVTAPLDRLKVYLIAQTGTASEAVSAAKSGAAVKATKHGMQSLIGACQELWAAGGMRSLFAGNGINVIKVMPESAVKFGSYEAAKRAVAKVEGHGDPSHINNVSQFVSGGVAGMISQAVVYPLDTLKFRMQCETVPGGEHGNRLLLHTAQKMWARNGIFSFYRGLPMGLVGMFPYAAIDLGTFEALKRYTVSRRMEKYGIKNEQDALPGNFTLALMGGFSGAIGASIVYPLNLLRTRLQSQGTASHPRTYTGIIDVTRQTIKGEGVRGLFKGLTPNLLKVVPAVSITYVVYENCKKALQLH